VRGLVDAFVAFTTVTLLQGSHAGQSDQQTAYAAALMAHPGGRWLVGTAGAAVVVAGIALVVDGLRLTFLRHFPADALAPRTRTLVTHPGRVGTTARGLVLALTGGLVGLAETRHRRI
jgi:hypothetical protein